MTQYHYEGQELDDMQAEVERLRAENEKREAWWNEWENTLNARLARLHRIEEAAREVDEAAGLSGSAVKMTTALRALRAALEEEA